MGLFKIWCGTQAAFVLALLGLVSACGSDAAPGAGGSGGGTAEAGVGGTSSNGGMVGNDRGGAGASGGVSATGGVTSSAGNGNVSTAGSNQGGAGAGGAANHAGGGGSSGASNSAGAGGDPGRPMGLVAGCSGPACPMGECGKDTCASLYPAPLTDQSALCALALADSTAWSRAVLRGQSLVRPELRRSPSATSAAGWISWR